MSRLFSLSRYMILIPVVVTLLGALVLFVAGAISMVNDSFELLVAGANVGKSLKTAAVTFIEVVDIFLLGTVLYIIAVGLYELFIGELQLPAWLVIKSLDDLKAQLVSVVIAVLAVLFLGVIVGAKGEPPLTMGLAISPMILALTLFLSYKTTKGAKNDDDGKSDHQ